MTPNKPQTEKKTIKHTKILDFPSVEIWRFGNSEKMNSFSAILRVSVLAVREFFEHKCPLQAASLTFFTLMSIVPFFAIAFAIARGFGLDQCVDATVRSIFSDHIDIANAVIDFSTKLLERTSSGGIAGVGILIVLWAVIRLFSNMENSFNEVWSVKRSRSFIRKFTDYFAICFVMILGLALTTSVTAYMSAQLPELLAMLHLSIFAENVLRIVSWITPFVFSGLLFTFLYVFIPNTKVKLKNALIAGFIAGCLFQGVQMMMIYLQVGFMKANPIYGSLAALPVFLLWLQFSWTFLLFGCELSYACQNIQFYAFEPDCRALSRRFKDLVAVLIMQMIAKRFEKGDIPPQDSEIAKELELPIRLVNEQLQGLHFAKLLIQAIRLDGITGWRPDKPIHLLTPLSVVQALHSAGEEKLPLYDEKAIIKIRHAMDDFDAHGSKTSANTPLTNL